MYSSLQCSEGTNITGSHSAECKYYNVNVIEKIIRKMMHTRLCLQLIPKRKLRVPEGGLKTLIKRPMRLERFHQECL